ncbi:MAG: hydrogenase expression/formation protein HypE [Pseudomonadota bacterium]
MVDDASRLLTCPVPAPPGDRVLLAHGGGGRAMARLIDQVFQKTFADPLLAQRHDGVTLELDGAIALTTDSYVVRPLFFPGGDIGSLAVNGTVNDLAMCGARPLYLSIGFILEEGLPIADLMRIVGSAAAAARDAGVRIVTGDTKVVERGQADGLYLNTTGLGRIEARAPITPAAVEPGDAVILSGDIGRHGIAVMSAREDLGFEGLPDSDSAPLNAPILALIEAGIAVHCLRDPTRGGVASALVEIAETAGVTIHIKEADLPVAQPVAAACELLGLDPLHVANEGRFVAIVPHAAIAGTLDILRAHPVSAAATLIGEVTEHSRGEVAMTTAIGSIRAVDMLSGEQLPRIC